MSDEKIPPEWVRKVSSTRPDLFYYYNKITGKAYWSHDMRFGENGKAVIGLHARQVNIANQRSIKSHDHESDRRSTPSLDVESVTTNDMESDDELDDEEIEKLYKAKSQKDLKRKHEATVSPNQSSVQNHNLSERKSVLSKPNCSNKASEVPNKIKKTSDKKPESPFDTERKSTSSSSSYHSQNHCRIGHSKTPIQDRFGKLREELLSKQEKSTDSGISVSSSKEGRTLKQTTKQNYEKKDAPKAEPQTSLHRTPIPDKYNKMKHLLLKNQGENPQHPESELSNYKQVQYDESRQVFQKQQDRDCNRRELSPAFHHSVHQKFVEKKKPQYENPEPELSNWKQVQYNESKQIFQKQQDRDCKRRDLSPAFHHSEQQNFFEKSEPRHSGCPELELSNSRLQCVKPERNTSSETSNWKRVRYSDDSQSDSSNLDGYNFKRDQFFKPHYTSEPETSNRKKVPHGWKETHSQSSFSSSNAAVHEQPVFGREETHNQSSFSSSNAVVHEQPVFDLRLKIQERKLRTASQNLQSDIPCPMEWEPCYAASPVPHAVPQNQLPPSSERQPRYSKMYLVCDTSALLKDYAFIEDVIVKGSYLGLSLTIVIPFIVFDELDKLKDQDGVGFKARRISRIIQSSSCEKHMILQEGDKNREAVGSLELKVNDDLVLNCCLQRRKLCGEDELAILITNDINLGNKAKSFKLQAHDCISFKRWARGFRLCKYQNSAPLLSPPKKVSTVTKMSIDDDSFVESIEIRNPSTQERTTYEMNNNGNQRLVGETGDSTSTLTNTSTLHDTMQSHLEELHSDLHSFLHNVLEEAYKREYKGFENVPRIAKASWTALDYICEVKKRWYLLTDSYVSPQVQKTFQQLISTFKKLSSGKDLKVEDVDDQFSRCAFVTELIAKSYPKEAHHFLQTLSTLRDDWKEVYSSLSQTINNGIEIEDVQPMDVALQHMYQCSQADYDRLKKEIDSNKFDTGAVLGRLKVFYGRIVDVESAMRRVFEEKPDALTIKNIYILQLQNLATFFSDVDENPIGFEIVPENVVELFQNNMFRNNAGQLIEKFAQLKELVDCLINDLE